MTKDPRSKLALNREWFSEEPRPPQPESDHAGRYLARWVPHSVAVIADCPQRSA